MKMNSFNPKEFFEYVLSKNDEIAEYINLLRPDINNVDARFSKCDGFCPQWVIRMDISCQDGDLGIVVSHFDETLLVSFVEEKLLNICLPFHIDLEAHMSNHETLDFLLLGIKNLFNVLERHGMAYRASQKRMTHG